MILFSSKLLPHFLPIALPSLFNTSFSSGIVPILFKHISVCPLLIKFYSDPEILANYRPVFLLQVFFKTLERLAASRLLKHISKSNLKETFQSAFKAGHSTKTALLNVTDDLKRLSDKGQASCSFKCFCCI